MITWNEQKPDFLRRSLDELIGTLAFTKACAVVLAGRLPRVLVEQSVKTGVLEHLQEQRVEMGGLLLGTVYEGLGGAEDFVTAITDFVRSVEFDGTGVSLRMDPDVWERARASANDATVIGWYHSHPNLGVFFSGTDRRTQRAFFNQPHSIGLVVDPVRREEKWFVGGDSNELYSQRVICVR